MGSVLLLLGPGRQPDPVLRIRLRPPRRRPGAGPRFVTVGSPRRAGSPSPTVIATFLVVVGIAVGAVLAISRPVGPAPSATQALPADRASLAAPATGTPAPSSSSASSAS